MLSRNRPGVQQQLHATDKRKTNQNKFKKHRTIATRSSAVWKDHLLYKRLRGQILGGQIL